MTAMINISTYSADQWKTLQNRMPRAASTFFKTDAPIVVNRCRFKNAVDKIPEIPEKRTAGSEEGEQYP